MKNNSKSGLRMQQIIGVVLTLIIMSANIQLFVPINKSIQISSNNNQEEIIENNIIQEETKIATQEREIKTTSRSSEERIIEEKEIEDTKYITIEEIKISRDMDLTKRCGISKEDFKILMTNLKSDTSGFFKENSDTIYDLCEKYELNEIFFCGLIAAE